MSQYYLNNVLHNEKGPAIKELFDNGNPQRINYYIKGKRHRIKGPAFIQYLVSSPPVLNRVPFPF